VSSNDVDSKIVEDVHVPPKTASITEDISVDSDMPIIDEIYVSSDGTSNNVNVKVKPNTTIVPRKPVESPRAEYSFIIVPTDSSFRESPEFLTKIQQMISSTSSFFGCLEFLSESNVPPSVPPSAGLDVCPPKHAISLILPSLGVMPRIPLHCIYLLHILMISLGRQQFAMTPTSLLQTHSIL